MLGLYIESVFLFPVRTCIGVWMSFGKYTDEQEVKKFEHD